MMCMAEWRRLEVGDELADEHNEAPVSGGSDGLASGWCLVVVLLRWRPAAGKYGFRLSR